MDTFSPTRAAHECKVHTLILNQLQTLGWLHNPRKHLKKNSTFLFTIDLNIEETTDLPTNTPGYRHNTFLSVEGSWWHWHQRARKRERAAVLRLHGDAVFLLACAWVRGAVSQSQEEILSVLAPHNRTLPHRSQIRTRRDTVDRHLSRQGRREGSRSHPAGSHLNLLGKLSKLYLGDRSSCVESHLQLWKLYQTLSVLQ